MMQNILTCSWQLAIEMTTAEVGYTHLGCFAAAFKRQFGITPSKCVNGKVASSGNG